MDTPDELVFRGLEPFDAVTEDRVATLSGELLTALQANLNAPTDFAHHGEDIEVPKVDWGVVEYELLVAISKLPLDDRVRLLAYWSSRWNMRGGAPIAMDRASGRGIPTETYALLARCCANAIVNPMEE